MKVDSFGRVIGPQGSRPGRPAAPGKGDQAFSRLVEGEVSEGAAVGGSAPISGIDALLALQGVDSATDRAQRARKRGEALLRGLEGLRDSILDGLVSADQLQCLARQVQAGREGVDDPALSTILDEIDLRVQVELAKRGLAG